MDGYPCCEHCWHWAFDEPRGEHTSPCLRCRRPSTTPELTDEFGLPLTCYQGTSDANPERRGNGCQIYRVNQDPNQEHDATPGGSNTVCTVCGRWESNGIHR